MKPSSLFRAHSYLAVPLLLGAIAGWQIYRVHAAHLSPWKGGGFGMFSTVDSPGNRFLHCKLIRNERGPEGQGVEAHAVRVPKLDHRRDLLNALRAMPNERELRTLAKELSSLRWTSTTPPRAAGAARSEPQQISVFKDKASEPKGARRFEFDRLSLELKTLDWSWSELKATSRTLLSVTVDVVDAKDIQG